ncbi:MAG: uracil-DNA glycosylase [Christensenellaceae bacterium]|jgi:uracil-DNA glycosylase|nr:uracil-DNA glycosylase [Christensenellaceae bacterium]
MLEEWEILLKPLCESESYKSLSLFLDDEYGNYEIMPPRDCVFKAFEYCAPQDIKVVILGQDPYPTKGVAMGLSFSVNKNTKLPPSLNNIFRELQTDLRLPEPRENGDLSDWARQGVLLLNATLTVRSGAPLSHLNKGWEELTDGVISRLAEAGNKVFMLWGANAQKKERLIDTGNNLVIKSAHPSPLSARNGFFGSRPFSRANDYLKGFTNPIVW